jgi:hypothetical protein
MKQKNWTTGDIDKLIKLRRSGMVWLLVANALDVPRTAVKSQNGLLHSDLRASIKRDFDLACSARKRRKAREVRAGTIGPHNVPTTLGPLSRDSTENEELIALIFAGRKFESYRFRTSDSGG